MSRSKREFPSGFYWGASTAAHQVEGGHDNQWSEWELAHAQELASSADERLGWLPNYQDIQAQASQPDNYVSGRGVAHEVLYEQDFDVLTSLNMNAFRFSIEWSRLEPEEGRWDAEVFAYYRHYLVSLKRRGIEPFVTLWHWTLPRWFAEKGGFAKRSNVTYFERFVEKVDQELLGDVTYIITLNEPNVYTSFSYVTGEWAPQRRNVWVAWRVYVNLMTAHRRAYRLLKAQDDARMIGVAQQLADSRAKQTGDYLARVVAGTVERVWNWWFLDRIQRQMDFVGCNYYSSEYRDKRGRLDNPKEPVNDLGWYMEPARLQAVLEKTWQRYDKPVIVTENGLADAADTQRRWWLEESLKALRSAVESGADVRGYLHWSLLDNFEWKYGWWPKFGLIEVQRDNRMRRRVRPSAKWLAKQLKNIS